MEASPFASFLMAGFECSSQRRKDHVRLDLIAATGHDLCAQADYAACVEHGLATVRDGLRWHRIERAPGVYDWSSWRPMLDAANAAGVQVIWDICHYGWPDFLDVWSERWVERLAYFAESAAAVLREHTDAQPLWCPVNEISFLTWAAGEVGYFFPAARGRGDALKRQLVRGAVAASEACLRVDPRARLVWCEPLVKVEPLTPEAAPDAAREHAGQFEALDMIGGRRDPELGGRPALLDIVGVNYYPHNQWFHRGPTIPMGHHAYTDLHELLGAVATRYGRPMIVAETGAERRARAPWLHYVGEEVREAMAAGAEIWGLNLYPILAYPGWDDGRHCDVGLLSTPPGGGERTPYAPLAREIARQGQAFAAAGVPNVAPHR